MKFIQNILAVNSHLNLALLVALGSVIAMEAYLFDMPEIVPWGEEFGAIYYKLCVSLMASYIFYFIVIHLKSQADKKNSYTFVATKVNRIIDEYKSQIEEMKKATNFPAEQAYLSKVQIEEIFKTINPQSNAPMLIGQSGKYANWIQFMSYSNGRTQKLIEKIFLNMLFLDSALVRLLSDIEDCDYFKFIEAISRLKFGNQDMTAWANAFYEYSVRCEKLENYYQKKLSCYAVTKAANNGK